MVRMAATKDSNIVKIAIVSSDDLYNDTQQSTQFIEFDQKRPLTSIIQELCATWNVDNFEQYGLKSYDQSGLQVVGRVRRDVTDKILYVNEKNRNEVKNGSVLCLAFSPAKTAQDILENVTKGPKEAVKDYLNRLSILAGDPTFAQEFINKQGLQMLISSIELGAFKEDPLAYSLSSFTSLMDHGIIFWDVLQPDFIKTVASYVNNKETSKSILGSALNILECVVVNSSSNRYQLVEQQVTLPNIIMHLSSDDIRIQQYAIAFINSLLLKADPPKRKSMAATLTSRQVRAHIPLITGSCKAEMLHQLYVLQTILLNQLEERMNMKLDPQDHSEVNKIVELRKSAFDCEDPAKDAAVKKPGGIPAKDFKKLGFRNHTNPAEDFQETPPGLLALDCMMHLSKYHQQNYTKIVLENSCRSDEHECPFARTSIQLTKLLCEILKIGEQPTEQGSVYYPMFFTQEHPFEEFFCISIMLLNKTWKEMRATIEDLPKVLSVVKEQITRALPTHSTSMETFKGKLNTLTYNEITNIWQQERNYREEWVSQAKPIKDLREHITPEITELIQQQRLNYLVEGAMFTKYSPKGQRIKDKFWYCRLAPNHKVFHYGDCSESAMPSLEQLQTKIPVVDIKSLVVGKECPHMKEFKIKKSTAPLAFSILLDSEQGSLDFVAPSEQVRDHWTDGINALLGQPMSSEETKIDLETLLSMDIKLRLLDTEGIKIPETPPVIPLDPPNYEFYYDYK